MAIYYVTVREVTRQEPKAGWYVGDGWQVFGPFADKKLAQQSLSAGVR